MRTYQSSKIMMLLKQTRTNKKGGELLANRQGIIPLGPTPLTYMWWVGPRGNYAQSFLKLAKDVIRDYFHAILLNFNIIEKPLLIDLQLFAAEDEGRTAPPSERRRREEKAKGRVPRSQELASTIVLLGGIASIYILGEYFFKKSALLFRKYFEGISGKEALELEGVRNIFQNALSDATALLLPILAITFLFAIVGNVVQVGLFFSPGALGFKFENIAPNFRRIIPNRLTFFNLGKSLLKVLAIGFVSYFLIRADFLKLLLLGDMGLKSALSHVAFSAAKIFFVVGFLLLVIGFIDFLFQRYEFEESLKQTPSEAKQETKEEVGDTELLNRRRQMFRDMMQRTQIRKVPEADVVITNPTHYAVALVYEFGVHAAPQVLAKGEGGIALLIRKLATENNVPIIENPPLARQLFADAEVGREIPYKFFQAVSLVLRNLAKYQSLGGKLS